MELNKIYNEDCLEGIKRIPDKSVDMIVTDPPYLKKYSTGYRKNVRRSTTEIINDNKFDLDTLFAECKRVLRNDGHLYVFGCWQTGDTFKRAIGKYFKIKNKLIWVKNNWSAGDLFWTFGQSYEEIWFATNGRKRLNGKRDRDCLFYNRISGKRQVHLNQKPLNMIEFLISKSSVEGDVVLDPFMGSGTTAIACMNTGRNYIGFELDKEYYDKALKRIENLNIKSEVG